VFCISRGDLSVARGIFELISPFGGSARNRLKVWERGSNPPKYEGSEELWLRVSETEGVRDGVLGGLMEMVSFPVEEGWPNL